MRRESDQVELDRWLSALATSQHGVVAWFQLHAAGIPRGRVDRLLARGRLHAVHRGVYAVGHRVLTPDGWSMAAVLALGPTAVLSHRSAAALWGLLPPVSVAHVTVPGRGARRRRRGIVVHRIPETEATRHRDIPVTTVAWTLLDLAATAPAVLERAVEAAERERLFDLRALEPILRSSRPGVRELRRAIAEFDGAPVRSELERRFLALCRDHGLPRPSVNVMVEGFEVDFVWPADRVIVETDGGTHATRAAIERDRARDLVLALAGYRVLRFTWRQVTTAPGQVATAIRTALHP